MVPELASAASQARAWACYDCGKCTATCPIARAGGELSPRRHVLATNLGQEREILEDGTVFRCLTCSLCDLRCPAGVAYTGLVQQLRELARGQGVEPECPHGGALHSVMRMLARGDTQQDRLGWLGEDLRTDPKQGDVFYWTGCTMYFDAFFPELQVATLGGTRAAVRLMNRLGVNPVVSPDERCCGHDLLWSGDRESFELLAKHNTKLVAESGARTLVTSCAECLRTWKVDYEPFFEHKPPRLLHISEFLAERLPELQFRSNGQSNGQRRVTFQDPCRLGRHLGIYDPPRQVLRAVPGLALAEMQRTGPRAICCAGGTWTHCDRFAKRIQVERLQEARAAGAEVLVTGCPKCQIHFRCALKDPNLRGTMEIEMRDLAELVADALAPEAAGEEPEGLRKRKEPR